MRQAGRSGDPAEGCALGRLRNRRCIDWIGLAVVARRRRDRERHRLTGDRAAPDSTVIVTVGAVVTLTVNSARVAVPARAVTLAWRVVIRFVTA